MAGATSTEQRGLAAICEREYPVLVGALGLYLGDRYEAEDLAQEALVRLCQHWPLDGVANPGAWVMRVAFNLATSQLRRRRVQQRHALRRPEVRSEPEMDDVLAIRRAVLQLPERQRRAIVLRYYADLPVRDTAEQLGCPENTVKTLVHQAIKTMRAAGFEVTVDD